MQNNMNYKDIGARVNQIRKNLGLSRERFAEPLSVSGDVINNLERARTKNIPMSTIKLICSVYNVDYLWLTTGKGEMFHQSSNPVADKIDDLLEGENETAKAIFRAFAHFSDDDWKLADQFVERLLKAHDETKKDSDQ